MAFRFARVSTIAVTALVLCQIAYAKNKPMDGPIVSASLASDEILLALFPQAVLEDNLVLSSFVDNPAYSSVVKVAAKIPRRWHNSSEALIALKPKLVILASYNHPSLKIRLDKAVVPFIELKNFNQVADIKTHIKTIGIAVNKKKEALTLIENFQAQLDKISDRNKTVVKKPTLLAYSSMATPGGKDTLIDDIIDHAGGINLARVHGLQGWAKINAEILAGMNPDYVILSDGGLTRLEAIKQITNDPLWKHFSAVKNQRFIFVNQAKLTSVSHHVLDAISAIHTQLIEQINAKKI